MDSLILVQVKEKVLQRIQAGEILPTNLSQALNEAYQTLATVDGAGACETPREVQALPAVGSQMDWKKSINRHAVICLACGASFKQLSRKHLALHDLDPSTYRLKYGIPGTQALVAKETTVRRRKVAKWVKPWEKTTKSMRGKVKAS